MSLAVRIPIQNLLWKPNMPAGLNPFVLFSLAYVYRSTPQDVDPIVVKREGDNYRILDGRHRSVASMIAGRPDVLAVIES